MSSKNRSKSKSSSKRKNSTSTTFFDEDEKIDEIMKDITLTRPRNPYTQFVISETENLKFQKKDAKINLKEFNSVWAEKWKNLSNADKKKYVKLYEDEKLKYKADLEQVRHYLFKDINDSVRRAPTAYRIFLNEKLREGFEKGQDPKDVKKEASLAWSKMSMEEKKVYDDKKKDNDNWFLKAQKIRKVTPISLFIQNEIEEAKKQYKELPQLKDIAPRWKKLPKSKKISYEKYAQELNEEKELLQDIYEIIHGVKPKRPKGAFRIFLQEKAKNNEIKSLNHGHELWKKLSEEEKEEYLNKSHRCHLAYKYKKMIYKKQIKKMLPKKPLSALQYYLKEKKGQKPPEGENFLKYWRTMFDKLTPEQKKKYEDKKEKAKEVYEKKMEQFNNKVFDMPRKPVTGFALYVADRVPDLKKEKTNLPNNELIKMVAQEWQDGKIVNQSTYIKDAEKDKKRFKKQLLEFKKNGYYTKSKDKEEGEDDEDEKKSSKKKKSESKGSSKNTKKNRSSSKSSKAKESRSKSKKKSQKGGKSQKSNK